MPPKHHGKCIRLNVINSIKKCVMQNLNSFVIKPRIVHILKTNVIELLINNTVISDDKLIAESFNEYFTNILQILERNWQQNHTYQITIRVMTR